MSHITLGTLIGNPNLMFIGTILDHECHRNIPVILFRMEDGYLNLRWLVSSSIVENNVLQCGVEDIEALRIPEEEVSNVEPFSDYYKRSEYMWIHKNDVIFLDLDAKKGFRDYAIKYGLN